MPLIVSGGDGTLFHLLQHLRPPFPEIAIVPKGRGNALARDLMPSRGPVDIDLLEVRVTPASGSGFTCYCASSVSFGYPTAVTRRSLAFRRLRRLSYAAATAVTAPRFESLTLSLDDEHPRTRPLAGVLVNNTRHVGGFVALPQASCSDGLADCMELSAGYVSQMAHNLAAMAGSSLWMPARVTRFRTAALIPDTPSELMLDGELFPAVSGIEIRVLPAALRCSCLLPGRNHIQAP